MGLPIDVYVKGSVPSVGALLVGNGSASAAFASGAGIVTPLTVGGTGVGFKNSWVNYSGSDTPARYWLDPFGMVHIEGAVMSGTSGIVFTLPSGYIPVKAQAWAIISNAAIAQVGVDTSGNVTLSYYSNVWAWLTGQFFVG